jgi:S1-C subfamily serine protease
VLSRFQLLLPLGLLWLISCSTQRQIRPAFSLNEDNSYGKLEGYGQPEKQFLASEKVPAIVLAKINGAVRRLCVCKIEIGNCVTAFAAVREQFLTNEHAINVLAEKQEELILHPKTKTKCDGEFLVQGPRGKAIPVKLSVLKRGKVHEQSAPDKISSWFPAKYFSTKTEDYSDHTQDLALVRLEGIKAQPLLAETELKTGEKIYHAGFPIHPRYLSYDQDKPVISEGTVLALTARNNEADFLGVNGTSGGPVVNASGDLVGVFWGKERTWREEPLNLNVETKAKFFAKYGYPRERSFFMPVEAVINFLKSE